MLVVEHRHGAPAVLEDLDDLLLATYSELRSRPNITVCVGGGIGTPERAAEYLSGRWAQSYGFPLMPVDGILVGTAAMATKESTTNGNLALVNGAINVVADIPTLNQLALLILAATLAMVAVMRMRI